MSLTNQTMTSNGTPKGLEALGSNLIGKKIIKLAWQATSMHMKESGTHPVDANATDDATTATTEKAA